MSVISNNIKSNKNNNDNQISHPKKMKIVPKSNENSPSAWKNDLLSNNEKPEYFENLLKTENPKPIKIYSIDIENQDDSEEEDLEANRKSNQRKSFLKQEKCRISIISENAWKNLQKTNVNSTKKPKKKRKNFKDILKKIVNCCPFKLPWVVVTISLIQVINLISFFL
jgi:hypothetical protein